MTPIWKTAPQTPTNNGRPCIAIMLSVDYADVLQYSLSAIRGQVSAVCVVTATRDKETQQLARLHDAQLVVTDAFFAGGAAMNLGRAYNAAFAAIDWAAYAWALLLNADIVVPADFTARWPKLRPDCLYGAPRRMVKSSELWQQWRRDGDSRRLRVKTGDQKHAVVPGYLQLVSALALQQRCPAGYPTEFATAGHGDMAFAKRWGKQQVWLPQEVWHLGPETVNWKGRQSERFV